MKKPNVLVCAGYGLNCEEETAFAFSVAGAASKIVHIEDVIDKTVPLDKFQIFALPGGFSFGDDTGSGNAFAQLLKKRLWDQVQSFITKDKLVIGICNGFQILVESGLLENVALLPNDSNQYIVRWVDIEAQGQSPWIRGITSLTVPIAHGEGKLYAPPEIIQVMETNHQISFRYTRGEICSFFSLPANPTGTLQNVASITNSTGKIIGMMPHPERALFFTQLPHWTYLKEKFIREGRKIPTYGPGLKVFQNGVTYFR